MRTIPTIAVAFVLGIILGGCNGNGAKVEESASATPAPEPQAAGGEGDAWRFVKPWTWFESKDQQATETAATKETQPSATAAKPAQGEPAAGETPSEETGKDPWRFVKPWDWFGGKPAPEEPAVAVEETAQGTQPKDPWRIVKPWDWFGEKAPPPQPTDTTFTTAGSVREPFTYVEVKQRKGVADYLLPWRWFEKNKTVAEVPEFEEYQAAEAAPAEEKGAMDFLKFWKEKKPKAPKPMTLDDVLHNMSPELATRTDTKDELRIRRAKIVDINTRTVWDDLNEMFFLDRPSRLSMTPSP